MDLKEHTTPNNLVKYSFLWSIARLVIAAVALFLGGYPPAMYLVSNLGLSGLYSITGSLLSLAWIISGVVAVYLGYRWYTGGQTVFGGKEKLDVVAFFVMIVSGINLGLTGLLGNNIGMSISSDKLVFIIVGVIYLATAGYLMKRWKESGEKLFSGSVTHVEPVEKGKQTAPERQEGN